MSTLLRTDAQGERFTSRWWTTVRMAARIALTAAVLTSATAASADAQVAVPRDFAGLSDWGWPTTQQSQQIAADGIGTFRAGVAWEWIEARQGQRGWGGVDKLMSEASSGRYELVLVLNGCTTWACGATRMAPQTPQARAFFQSYVADFVGRYGAGGSFWRSRPQLAPIKVSWQVFNEVNVGVDWPNPTAAAYADLLAETSSTIKRVDPSATVVAAGLAELPAVREGAPLARFLSELEQIPSFRQSADVIAVHGYAEHALGTARVLDTARSVMQAAGDARPLWVTEIGWGTGGPAHPFVRDAAGQAAELRASFDLMTACRQRWGLGKAIWFALRDVTPAQLGEPDYWGMHTGIYGADGVTPKPAAAALREYTGGRTLPAGRATACPLNGGNGPVPPPPPPGPGDQHVQYSDGQGPTVTVIKAPQFVGKEALSPEAERRAKIHFVTNMGDRGRAECALDGGPWQPCATPYVIPEQAEGRHQLQIRGVDVGEVVSPQPAVVTWTVDLTPPRTAFRKKPPKRTKSRVVRVQLALHEEVRAERVARKRAKQAGKRGKAARRLISKARREAAADAEAERVTFQCSLNNGRWQTCKASHRVKAKRRGTHRLRVRAVDAAGNVDPKPVLAKFVVR